MLRLTVKKLSQGTQGPDVVQRHRALIRFWNRMNVFKLHHGKETAQENGVALFGEIVKEPVPGYVSRGG